MELIIVVVLVLLVLFWTQKENMKILKHRHYPHSFYPQYVNDLEVTAPRLLDEHGQRYRIPPHDKDMRNQFMVRNDSDIVLDMNQ